jgi:predicted nuclease with TOPRIM domain
MNNKELKKNAEGYADPTAAATLRQIMKGDIWSYKDGECLILQTHDGFATILRLHKDKRHDDRVKICDRLDGPEWVDPAFIISGKYADMSRYIETLERDDFQKVMDAVKERLGIKSVWNDNAEQENLRAMVDDLSTYNTELRREVERLQGQLEFTEERLSKAVDRVNRVVAAKWKLENQLGLLQSMIGTALAQFQVDTES